MKYRGRGRSVAGQRQGCENPIWDYGLRVKFVLALLVYLLMGFVLGLGILLTVKGSPWFLIFGFLAYALLFAKLGCLPAKTDH